MAEIGDRLAEKYRLTKLMGEGGMGVVYEAEHEELGKRVAIKFLHSELARDEAGASRFKREARAAAATGHRSIVDIYDIGTADDGSIFLVMELLRGESMGQLLSRKGTLDVSTAAYILAEVLSALHDAHEAGIVHRDIKPDNIFLVRTGKALPDIKLLDFGASQMVDPAHPEERLTKSGIMLGTPYYMAPEQASGDKGIDRTADVYAVGVVLYEALTGVVPFKADNVLALIRRILDAPLVGPRDINPDIPEALEAVIIKAMARNCDDRYATASEMLSALLDFLDETTVSRISIPEELASTASALPKTVAVHTSELSGNEGAISNGATEEAPVAKAHKGPDTDMAWTGKTMPTPTDTRRKRIRIGIGIGVVMSVTAAFVLFMAWPFGEGSGNSTPITTLDPVVDAGDNSTEASTAEVSPSAHEAIQGEGDASLAQQLDANTVDAFEAGSLNDESGHLPTDRGHPRRTSNGKRPRGPGKRPATGGQTPPTPPARGEPSDDQEPPTGQNDGQGNPVLRQDFQI